MKGFRLIVSFDEKEFTWSCGNTGARDTWTTGSHYTAKEAVDDWFKGYLNFCLEENLSHEDPPQDP